MIPDYQSLMLPLLKLVSDKQEHKYRDLIEKLAIKFQITDEERKELLASGNQAIFDNRVGWAKTYLKKALETRQCCRSTRDSEICRSISRARSKKRNLHYNVKLY